MNLDNNPPRNNFASSSLSVTIWRATMSFG